MRTAEIAAALELEYGYERAVRLCLRPEPEFEAWRAQQPLTASELREVATKLLMSSRSHYMGFRARG
jgi:hypothetical protein